MVTVETLQVFNQALIKWENVSNLENVGVTSGFQRNLIHKENYTPVSVLPII